MSSATEPAGDAPPQPAAGHRARRDRARASVLSAALELAAEAPFSELTIEQIAGRAGISRSAFYLHFRDKHDLLEAAAAGISGELASAASRSWRGEGAPAERIRRAVEGFVSVYGEHAGVMRVLTEVSGYDEELRRSWMGMVGRFITATTEQLATEQKRGLVPDRLDAGAAAEALVWMNERCCYVYLGRGRSAEEVVEQLSSVWTAALYPGVVPADELRPGSPGGHLWGLPAPRFD